MNRSIEDVLRRLRHISSDPRSVPQAEYQSLSAALAAIEADQVPDLLVGLAEGADEGAIAGPIVHYVLQKVQRHGLDSLAVQGEDPSRMRAIERLYRQRGTDEESGYRLLAMLSAAGDTRSLSLFAELMVTDPPREPESVVQAFSPLWRQPAARVEAIFPRIWEALQYPAVAVVVLDLANFLYHRRRLAEHPARSRTPQLVALLGHVVERLEGWEDACAQEGVADVGAARQVADGVALAVALAYALSLMDVREAGGKLHRMLALQHRRLRVEAAAALARWEDPAAIDQLVRLASEPVVRLRVLAYAEELGLLDRIDPTYRTVLARHEAELVARLADPSWFGVPPTRCEFVEQRHLYWPGSSEPVDCFLFEYCYELPTQTLRNVGLAGPSVECLPCDLTPLTRQQQYAVFAGWALEDARIGREELPANFHDEGFAAYRQSLSAADCELVECSFIGLFFGQRVLVGRARKGSVDGCAVVTPETCAWYPRGDAQRPLTPDVAFAAYVGSRLLAHFNPGQFAAGEARPPEDPVE